MLAPAARLGADAAVLVMVSVLSALIRAGPASDAACFDNGADQINIDPVCRERTLPVIAQISAQSAFVRMQVVSSATMSSARHASAQAVQV